MKQIKTLVLMQLRDKIDLSWMKSTKDRIHMIILSIVKFLILVGLYTVVLWALNFLGVVYYYDMPKVMTFVLTILLFMLTISCTAGLTKSLYFSEDNKVLITLPVNNNKIFISKLLVFLFYEVKRSFSFTIPIVLGCMINTYIKGYLNGFAFLWMILPLALVVVLPVLLGALLSIPALYISRFVSRYAVTKVFIIILGLAAYVLIFLSITKYLPKNIDLINQWPEVRRHIVYFLNAFEGYNPAITWITRSLIGEEVLKNINGLDFSVYQITGVTILKYLAILGVCCVLFAIIYFVSRPIFFSMMSKSFEFNKDQAKKARNIKHNKVVAFNLKEMKVSFRSLEISINYLLVYTTIPLLIFILDSLFGAIEKNQFGISMSYAFNILLIIFPLLLSNSLIATLYSKEGRAGYIKKTKPVNPLLPLLSKLSFNIILSIPSIIASVLIFANYINVCSATFDPENPIASINAGGIVLFIFAVLLLHYAHLFYCAKLDIMNPQNEVYATSGNDVNNVNENKATIIGALVAFIYSVFAFKLFSEEVTNINAITIISLKLFLISLLFALYFITSFVLSVKAFYAPSKE